MVLPDATKAALKRMLVYDREVDRAEHTPVPRARPGVRDSHRIVRTAAGEPISGAVADAADGDG